MKVAVVGCGPAGLLAAWAAVKSGVTPTIISKRIPSVISGAQYLHKEIPDLDHLTPFKVRYKKEGTAQGYAQKVYGNPEHVTSWGRWEEGEVYQAWSLERVYAHLWEIFNNDIMDFKVDPLRIRDILDRFDLVLSTVPLPLLCINPEHVFDSNVTWITSANPASFENNTIIYNGDPDCDWFRSSCIDQIASYEFATARQKAAHIRKPQSTNCDCHPTLIRLGRFGMWKRDVLTSDAYTGAMECLEK